MKLLVFVCVCALAAAEQQQGAAPSAAQLAVGLTSLYRRFLHVAAPEQLKIADALDIKWRNGMLSSPPFRSPVKGTFAGAELPTFSYVNSLVNPGQKGFFGKWMKQDTSDIVVTYHYGGSIKIHMLTDGGVHKEAILGNPLNHKKEHAKFVVVIPKTTYCTFESLSEDDATFHSFMSVPAWVPANAHEFTNKEMEAKFPDHAEMFHELSEPGVHHDDNDYHHDDDHHDDDHDWHNERRARRNHHKH